MSRGGTAGSTDPLGDAVRDAYDRTAEQWDLGPARVYEPLAGALLDDAPCELSGRSLLDLGAGTGAVSRVATARGATVVAVDAAAGMLAHDRRHRPPSVVADVRRLPFVDDGFDVAAAAFVLNHLPDARRALAEAVRVLRPGGWLLASTFEDAWDHPAKQVVEEVASSFGYRRPAWYETLKDETSVAVGARDGLGATGVDAGLVDVEVITRQVDVGLDDAAAMVAWRLGMANLAPFAVRLQASDRHELVARAIEALGPDAPPLRPGVLHLVGRCP